MINMSFDNLPSKFRPYLLGPSFELNPEDWKDVETQFYSGKQMPNREHVIITEKYIFKGPRSGVSGLVDGTTHDTHLYRIRKAEKIQKYIDKNNLQNELFVPKKCLYWSKNDKVFYVVSQKISLSNEVAKPTDGYFEACKELNKKLKDPKDQQKALLEGNNQRPLTPKQAKALAELSFSVGLNDLIYNNLFFTKQGQVAIIDTEPSFRFLKKEKNYDFILGKEPLSTKLGLYGVAHLSGAIYNDIALKEVRKIERKYVAWCIAKLIGKIAVLCFASCAVYLMTPMRLSNIFPITTRILSLLPLWKTPSLLAEIRSVYNAWNYSCQRMILPVLEECYRS